MPPAAIVLGSAAIGAGASALSAGSASRAQRDAANQNAALTREQIAEERRQYDLNREDLRPYREAGALRLADLMAGTSGRGDFARDFTMADFEADPGYQFRLAEGNRAIDRSAAGRGGLFSGGTLKALARYNQGMASDEFGAAYNRFNANRDRRFNRLASLAGIGQTATNTGIAAGQDYMSGRRAATEGLMGQNNAIGNARASQYAATGQAIGGAANTIGQYYAMRDLYRAAPPITPGR